MQDLKSLISLHSGDFDPPPSSDGTQDPPYSPERESEHESARPSHRTIPESDYHESPETGGVQRSLGGVGLDHGAPLLGSQVMPPDDAEAA